MKKNVVLIMVDQLRFDCLGINGNTLISTPNLNQLAATGQNFTQAYSAVPSCIPARATVMTGLHAVNHGKVGYQDGGNWDYQTSLAGEFAKRGYYTKCIGKMHVYPPRKMCGYHHIELHDGYLHHNRKYDKTYREQFEYADDYLAWLKTQRGSQADLIDLGLDCNSWVARSWPYDEMLHPTNWVVTRGIDFLNKKDPTMPFFLKLSFTRPHSPLDPPAYYFDMYKERVAQLLNDKSDNWLDKTFYGQDTFSTIAKWGRLPKDELARAIAAYYGLVTHIDHQIGRFMIALEEHDLLDDTVIMFVSDHGDQLGEHHLMRKGFPYQGSIHIPFIVNDRSRPAAKIDAVVELCDILPTLIGLATNEQVEHVDGKDLCVLMDGAQSRVRHYLHGEHELGEVSSQFIITEEWKYIWYSQSGLEQLFHLADDENEANDLIDDVAYADVLQELRELLISELANREEGFVQDGRLVSGQTTKVTLEEKDGIFNNPQG